MPNIVVDNSYDTQSAALNGERRCTKCNCVLRQGNPGPFCGPCGPKRSIPYLLSALMQYLGPEDEAQIREVMGAMLGRSPVEDYITPETPGPQAMDIINKWWPSPKVCARDIGYSEGALNAQVRVSWRPVGPELRRCLNWGLVRRWRFYGRKDLELPEDLLAEALLLTEDLDDVEEE